MKMYTITYKPVGAGDSEKTDFVDIFTNSISKAIKEFTELTELSIDDVKYTEHAIVKIEVFDVF